MLTGVSGRCCLRQRKAIFEFVLMLKCRTTSLFNTLYIHVSFYVNSQNSRETIDSGSIKRGTYTDVS